MDKRRLDHLSLGGGKSTCPKDYSPEALEFFDNRHPHSDAWTSFICPEFTALCPKTGQPDFACVTINYIAEARMVESKSLKLYLFSFRNHGTFHEDAIRIICDDLADALEPKFIEVFGEFYPRGGISLCPYASRDNGGKPYREIREKRMSDYSPGRYRLRRSFQNF